MRFRAQAELSLLCAFQLSGPQRPALDTSTYWATQSVFKTTRKEKKNQNRKEKSTCKKSWKISLLTTKILWSTWSTAKQTFLEGKKQFQRYILSDGKIAADNISLKS